MILPAFPNSLFTIVDSLYLVTIIINVTVTLRTSRAQMC
jgi:hypothetical protein